MSMRIFLAAIAAIAVIVPAEAAISILGGGMGRECYLAAEFKRDYRTSLDVCERALSDESLSRRDRSATLVNRGILHMHANDLDRAIADYQSAIRLDPKLAESHINLGIALLHRGGKDSEAIQSLSYGLSLGPSRPEVAYYSRAVAHEISGNIRAAYEDYQAAAAAKPGWEEPIEQLKRFSVERREVGQG